MRLAEMKEFGVVIWAVAVAVGMVLIFQLLPSGRRRSQRSLDTANAHGMEMHSSSDVPGACLEGDDLGKILETLTDLERMVQASAASSSGASSRTFTHRLKQSLAKFVPGCVALAPSASPEHRLPQPEMINDYVYEVHKPLGRPSVELVFFHGFQLEGCEKAYINTWISRDGSQLWLNWIVKAHPNARIVTICYDASAKRTHDQGNTDMYITRENLVQCLTDGEAQIGQDGCPVVLVGHCLGGLVMKQLCVQANLILSLDLPDRPNQRVQTLLRNVKGLFFYASPHHGSRLADRNTSFSKGKLFEDVTTLNGQAQRQNEEFRKLRQKYGWKAYGIGEGLEVILGGFKGLVVAEASARYDVDSYYTEFAADHFNVCKPVSAKSSNFTFLSNFICDILDEEKAREGPKIHNVDEVVGLDEQAKIVLKKLEHTPRLGLVGMGGIGKTALAEHVYNCISDTFEYTCFLREVKTSLTYKENMDTLQALVKSKLCCKGQMVDPNTFEWSTLKNRSVLIVLDDAVSESQVLVMTQSDGFSYESRVIVTTRESRILIPLEFHLHFVEGLSDEASRRLFCLHAFKTTNVPRGYEDRVAKFTKKCGGLPLALRVAGRYLYNRTEGDLWDDVLEKLTLAQEIDGSKGDGLWSILKASYESLATSEQEMFLDIAACFHDEDFEAVKQAWKVCGWASASSGWANLVDKGLVTTKVIEGTNKIWMHEMLRDLGCSIAYPYDEDVLGHTRLNIGDGDQLPVWQFNQEKLKVKVLKIMSQEVNLAALNGLEDLRILWLDHVRCKAECGSLPRKLKYLNMEECFWSEGLDSRTYNRPRDSGEPSSLNLKQYTTLKHLRVSPRFRELEGLLYSLWQLPGLQHLEIVEFQKLTAIPDSLGQLPRLRQLKTKKLREQTARPESLGQLRALQHLEIVFCTKPTAPPEDPRLQKLNLREVIALPESLGQLPRLQHLKINLRELTGLPESLGQLEALQHMEINCSQLTVLPESLGQLRALQHLEINYCSQLTALPESFGQLRVLRHLQIDSCFKLRALPESLGQLRALQHLEIVMCRELTVLPFCLGQLRALQHLEVVMCRELTVLPQSLGQLRALQHLEIKNCWGLPALPESLGQLRALQHLAINYCVQLTALPESLGQLRALQYLEIKDCSELRALPNDLGELRELQRLEITGHRLGTLPDSLKKLRAIRHLEIAWCRDLEPLRDILGQLQPLEHLTLFSMKGPETILRILGELQVVKHLKIWRGKNEFDRAKKLLSTERYFEILPCSNIWHVS